MFDDNKIVDFVYVVHGIVPALMAKYLSRYANGYRPQSEMRRCIKCPNCKGRLTDVNSSAKVQLFRNPNKNKAKCHGFIQCQTCKEEVGIYMTMPLATAMA